jgi:hypothetical protein
MWVAKYSKSQTKIRWHFTTYHKALATQVRITSPGKGAPSLTHGRRTPAPADTRCDEPLTNSVLLNFNMIINTAARLISTACYPSALGWTP